MQFKRFLSALVCFAMLLGFAPAALAADASAPATRGEVCAMLLSAADDYNPGVQKSDILRGGADGDLRENDPVTRAEALVMLQRAFGTLPTPVGDNARSAYPASSFTDVPDWAQNELKSVFAAGIVAGTSETTFSPSQSVTAAQMDLFIRRVYSLMGTNAKDDLYATVNKTYLDASVIKPGRTGAGTFNDLTDKSDADVAALITELTTSGKTYTKGTPEQKIVDLYQSVMDWDARNAAGVTPLKPYLDAIDGAKSLDELMQAHHKIANELGISTLLGFSLTVDMKDSSRYILYFYTPTGTLTKENYAANGGKEKEAYLRYLTTLGSLSGRDETQAAADANTVWEAERAVSAKQLSQQDRINVDKIYNLYTMQQLKDLFPELDMDAVLKESGLKVEDKIMVQDTGALAAYAPFLTQAQLPTAKLLARLSLINSYSGALSKSFTDASNTFNADYIGVQGTQTDEEIAAITVQQLLSDYLGKLYIERHFSAQAKADVTKMVKDFISVYKSRIQKLDWMSASTKQKATEKLDAMGINIGYPDNWDSVADDVTFSSPKDGGSYFNNLVALQKATMAWMTGLQGKPVDKTMWVTSAYTVNAYYNPTSNDITFPAGILQAPFYDVNAKTEQNLGGIGYVIAHEITHAFDNNGAKFDKNGNATDWWTAEDYAAFQKLCDKAIAFYDGQESAPGITCNGTLTLSENIADLGGAACVTEVAQQLSQPDMKLLYSSMANVWCSSYSREMQQYLQQLDVHAPHKLRANRVVQSCDAFYTAFDIQPGDGMYLAPEDRISIW